MSRVWSFGVIASMMSGPAAPVVAKIFGVFSFAIAWYSGILWRGGDNNGATIYYIPLAFKIH